MGLGRGTRRAGHPDTREKNRLLARRGGLGLSQDKQGACAAARAAGSQPVADVWGANRPSSSPAVWTAAPCPPAPRFARRQAGSALPPARRARTPVRVARRLGTARARGGAGWAAGPVARCSFRSVAAVIAIHRRANPCHHHSLARARARARQQPSSSRPYRAGGGWFLRSRACPGKPRSPTVRTSRRTPGGRLPAIEPRPPFRARVRVIRFVWSRSAAHSGWDQPAPRPRAARWVPPVTTGDRGRRAGVACHPSSFLARDRCATPGISGLPSGAKRVGSPWAQHSGFARPAPAPRLWTSAHSF